MSCPGTGGAHQPAGAGVGVDHRRDGVVGGLLAAAHHRQDAVLRAGLAAGDRRVDEARAARLGGLGEFAGDRGRGRGVVDEDRAFLEPLEGAVRGGGDAAQVLVVADAGEDDLRARRRRGRGRRALLAVLLDPGLRAVRRSVVDGHAMALGGEMTGHRIAHDPKPDECDLSHGKPPLTVVALYRP